MSDDGGGSGRDQTGTTESGDKEKGSGSGDDGDDAEGDYHPAAPNGGYGWVIVAAAFCTHFVADGVAFSFGLLFPAIQRKYAAGKGESAMVGSLFLALPSLGGPAASLWIDTFGYRKTCIAGGALASFGFLISPLINSLWWMYLTFGVVSGFGLCLSYGASIVAVTNYFTTHRALATGVTVSGTGIGTFVFAPLIELLMRRYGLDGTLLILSAVLLNLCAMGALVRDLPPAPAGNRSDNSKSSETVRDTRTVQCDSGAAEAERRSRAAGGEWAVVRRALSASAVDYGARRQPAVDSASTLYLHYSRGPAAALFRPAGSLAAVGGATGKPTELAALAHGGTGATEAEETAGADAVPLPRVAGGGPASAVRKLLVTVLRLDLFAASPAFALFCANSLLLYAACDVPYINLPEYAAEQFAGVTQGDASLLVSIIGIVNIPGMIAYGYLADIKGVNKMLLYSVSCAVCACCCAAPAFVGSYSGLAAACAGFGASVSANYTLATVLIAQVLPRRDFVAGYGVSSFAEGLGMLVGPLAAGCLYDLTGSYTSTFVAAGVAVAISALCIVPLVGSADGKRAKREAGAQRV